MEGDLKKIRNGRRPKKIKMEDDLKKIKKMEDDLKKNLFSILLKFKIGNGRRPKKNKKMEDDLKK
jgi:hypothetical protein